MKNIYQFAKHLTEKASSLIAKNYNKVRTISFKEGDFNLVTNVDHEVENFLITEIEKKYPTHSIIAEESGRKDKDPKYKWFIDPIDGTTNFAHSYPCFCVSIGFTVNEDLTFGLIKNPVTGELYSAYKGKGATLNNKRIKVSKIKKLKDSLLVTGFPHDKKSSKVMNFKNFEKLTLITQGVRRDGAAAMDLCYVAAGRLDGFWEMKLSPWDVAAGTLILKEAGGKITDFKGTKFNIYGKYIVATNGHIHKELLKNLRQEAFHTL